MVVANTMTMPYPAQSSPGPLSCYRHPDRPTAVSCTRCGRPVCPDCMRSAAVGQQCVDCVQAAAASVPPVRTAAGGILREGAPLVTYALMAINIAVYVMQMASGTLQYKLSLFPVAVAGGQYYRLLTSAFMHYGIVHILFNMYALYVLGPQLERHLGRVRFTALYLLSALGGSVVVYLFSPLNAATAGASGAIFGLFGATFVAAKRLRLDVRSLVVLIVINLVITFTVPGISWQGHVGGLLTGALVAAAYLYAPRGQRTLIQVGFTVGLLALFYVLITWRTHEILDMAARVTGRR
jgi:membrane associated rhomboid family serine protease